MELKIGQTRLLAGLTLGLLCACSPRPAEDNAEWRILGLGGGGAQFYPTISPHNSRRVMVGCDMTGSYISHDAGESWRMFNLRSRARFFAFDPVEPDVIYAGSAGLWRSMDAGATWNLIYPDPASITQILMPDDHAGVRYVTPGARYGNVLALAVDPTAPRILFAAVREGDTIYLEISPDQGRTWSRQEALLDGARKIWIDPRSSPRDRTLYVAGERSVAVRENGRWRPGATPKGASAFADVSLGFPSAVGKPVVYAVSESTVYVSFDGGETWTSSALPGAGGRLQAVATSLHHPDTAYVSYRGLELGGESCLGVAKTADRGKSWELVWRDSREKGAENVDLGWIRERFGNTWGGNPFTLDAGPDDPNICYGTDYGRTMRTLDGGKTWRPMYTSRLEDGSWVSTGLDVTTCYGVHFDPFDSQRVFISYTDIGLFKSENRGRSWTSATTGVPRPWWNTTYWIVFDPEVKGRVWGVMSGVHDLPRPKMWRGRSPSTYNGGVCLSEDGGSTWKISNGGMPETAATHILLDPDSPAGSRVLYVTGFGHGVFKSVDDGRTWSLKNNGLQGDEPFAWRLARDGDGWLYLIVARRSEDGSIGTWEDGALYRSKDQAESWEKVALPEGVNGPNGLAIDPEDPRRLYLAAWGRRTEQGAIGGGIFLSTDRGLTWRHVLNRDQHVYDVTIDQRNPNLLYAGGFESSAWRSEDRGDTWSRVRGYNFKWGHRVIPDPADAAMIYVTTFGGSVWHGPAKGTLDAVEDIVTPNLAYHP